jgi:hypothetical protein
MALSRMNTREKALVAALVVVIVLTLVGIGILAARLLTDGDEGNGAPDISVPEATSTPAEGSASLEAGETDAAAAAPESTITPVSPPSLQEADVAPPEAVTGQPVAVVRVESIGAMAPAIIADQVLHAGHRYEVEITARDGSAVTLQGSWSQAALGAGGQAAAPEVEFFEGTTPHRFDVVEPVAEPTTWRLSVSAAPKPLVGGSAVIVITVWDVSGAE